MPLATYLTVGEVRAEGAPFSDDSTYDDNYVTAKIQLASEMVERITGQWFVPLQRTFRISGEETKTLRLRHPIVKVDSIFIISRDRFGADPQYEIDVSEVQVYNRHLTEGLIAPDDRKNPGIEILEWLGYTFDRIVAWPRGEQNVKVTGKFGWTELGPSDDVGETVDGSQIPQAEGSTPLLIKRACMLLVRRLWPKVGDFQGLASATGNVTQMKVRDQSVTFGGGDAWISSALSGGLTGDRDIDSILLMHKCAPRVEVV